MGRKLLTKAAAASTARSSLVTVVLVLAVAGPSVFLVSEGDQAGAGTIVVAVVLIVLALIAAVTVGFVLSGVDPEAEAIADRLVPQTDQRVLIERWLRRTRWARNLGGMAGLLWWFLGTQARGPLLVCGLGGVALGSMAAQLHQARHRPGLRTASLEQRTVSQYTDRATRLELLLPGLGAVALVAAGSSAMVLSDEASPSVLWLALAALAVVALGAGLQRRVARRPRPALPNDLRYADDLARILAIGKGLGQPAGYWATALLAAAVGQLEPVIGIWAFLVMGLLWFWALNSWWQNRRLGLHHVLSWPSPDPTPGSEQDDGDHTEPAVGTR
jgi:hypothetical protein